MSKPVDLLETTVSIFYREGKINSKEVSQFSASGTQLILGCKHDLTITSANKMKEGTVKFADMMLSYNVKEELESWLAKLAETKVKSSHL